MRFDPHLPPPQSIPANLNLLRLPTLAEIDELIAQREREEASARLARDGEVIRGRCATLAGFIREAWHVLEPVATYVENWHIEVICRHLEAVTRGDITRLLINVPPGSMKSMIVSVFWPAWEWAIGHRSYRYVCTSFNDTAVSRDTIKTRDLVMSDWYRALWPEVVLTKKGEHILANTATGGRRGIAFGSLTGQRGDRLIIDDPHSIDTAESDVERASTTRRFRERAIFSINDAKRSAIVVIMQRLHENDISGVIAYFNMRFVHLRLPMEFEADNPCTTILGLCDPRTVDGELLDPIRVPAAELAAMKNGMTEYAWASQFQQRPAPREGGLFKRAWFADKLIERDRVPALSMVARHWDLAATKAKTAARTAGVKIGRGWNGKYYVLSSLTCQEEGATVRDLIKATAMLDRVDCKGRWGIDCEISLPKDPGQAGKVQASDYVSILDGFPAFAHKEDGEKEDRARPFSAQCEIGNVFVVLDAWTEAYLDELCSFPTGRFKDQVDASSGAYTRLAQGANSGMTFVLPVLVGSPRPTIPT